MNLNQFRNMFPDENACREYLEKAIWPSGRVCPHCGSLESWRIKGDSSRSGLYECSGCTRQFTVTTKTPLHSTKLSLRTWLLAMYFMINSSKGISSVFLAKWLGVNQKTAWKMGHAIRAMMAVHADAIGLLSGVVELDEKYLGGKPRFKHGVKHPRGKGTKKTCVHVAVSRKGSVRAGVIPGDSYAVLAPHVKQVVSPAARVMTDQLRAYIALGKEFSGHESVNHGIKEYARGEAHVNTAESFNAILERAKQGVFHYVSRQHIPRYLSEVTFRWNNRAPVKKKRNGLSKIVMQAKPVLEQFANLLEHAVGTQLRRTIWGGVTQPQPLYCG
ncbi:MAG: IS1595 family transposase [Gammaproteobacteria bacterium]|nr:IS1595 family transposase [Planctomycetaceae bacterium]MCP4491718.1 IS1595 family transposase [Gammaproteobacteria bacterium]